MQDNYPRERLCFIIKTYGKEIINDHRYFKGILKDLAPNHTRDTNLLVVALEQRVAYELLQKNINVPIEFKLDNLAKRLYENIGIQEELSYWIVESWALALNVIEKPLSRQKKLNSYINSTNYHAPLPEDIGQKEFVGDGPHFIYPPQKETIGKFLIEDSLRDGVAFDTETGLTWLRFSYGQQWNYNNMTGLYGKTKEVNYNDALNAVKSFNSKGFLGLGQNGYDGFTDWRMPSISELKTLLDNVKGKSGNYIDTDVFTNNSWSYWSSTPDPTHSNLQMIVDFSRGWVESRSRMDKFKVRFVRG